LIPERDRTGHKRTDKESKQRNGFAKNEENGCAMKRFSKQSTEQTNKEL